MGKFLVRYLIFWLPAIVFSTIFSAEDQTFQIMQWFAAFFMIFGWTINTGMAAYSYPRSALAALLTYSGFNIIVIVVMYGTVEGTGMYTVLRNVGGILSFRPLNIMVRTIRPFMVPHELVVALVLIGCCVVGYIVGLVQRHVKPNPYRPRIRRTRAGK